MTTINWQQAAAKLADDSVGILPTDTVYGLVCRAASQQAVGRLYGLKQRENKPGTVVAASIEQLAGLGLTRRYLKAVEQFWPGAVSVVIPCDGQLAYLHLGVGSLAVRLPDHQELAALLDRTGPLLTTSANRPGLPPANSIQEAQQYFGEGVDFYVSGGDLSGRQPSTVIRVVDDAVEVLRPGGGSYDR